MKKTVFFVILLLFLGASFAEAQLTAPTSPSPSDGATAEQPVILKWSSVEFPADIPGGYLLEIRGGNLPLDLTTWAETNSYDLSRIRQTLLAGRKHLWRVRACFGFDVPTNIEEACGPWSNNKIFWTFFPTLAKPKLVAPPNTTKEAVSLDGTVKPPSLKLEWENVVGADKYLVTLRKLSDGFTRVFEVRDPSKLIPDTFMWVNKSVFPLDLQNSYAWKVVAKRDNTVGPESDEWQFFLTLGKPTLVSPKSGDLLVYPAPQSALPWSWTSVSGAQSYVLEVFNAANQRVEKQTVPTTSFSTSLSNVNTIGETYSWRVTACEAQNKNCGPPSTRSNFTLIYASPTIISPTEGAPSVAPHTFNWKVPPSPFSGFLSPIYLWEIKGPTSISDKYTKIPEGEEVLMQLGRELLPGNYTWLVRACSQKETGCSAWSKDAAFTVPPAAFTVSPSSWILSVEAVKHFEAFFDPDGPAGPHIVEDKTNKATWSSNNLNVATVDDKSIKGLATCKAGGTAIITATLRDSLSAKATLTCSKAESVIPSVFSEALEMRSQDPILFPWPEQTIKPNTSTDRDHAVVLTNKTDSPFTVTVSISTAEDFKGEEGFKLLPSLGTGAAFELKPKEQQDVRIRFTAPSQVKQYIGTLNVGVLRDTTHLGFASVSLLASVESPAPAGPAGAPGATGGPGAGPGVSPSGAAKTISDVADRAANVTFTALLIAASLFVLLAAFQFVTGSGNPEAISGARDKLIWAAVGIGVALVSKGVATILQNILLGPSKEGVPKSPLCPPTPTTGIPNPLCTTTFSGLLDSIINVIFTLSLIVVPFVVLYAGFLFVTGGGNPQQIVRARNTLIWTAVGFGVILIAKGLPFILKEILGI